MDRYQRSNDSIVQKAGSGVQTYMAQVYGWMTCGLLLTAFVAWYVVSTPEILFAIISNKVVFYGLVIAQVALVFVLSGLVHKMSGALATGLFMLYSMLTGLTLSCVLIRYTGSSIASTFVISAGMFCALSVYGYTTKRSLSGLSSFLFMGLIGILLASLINIWLKSPALMWVITYIGVVVFAGLTAYDTQKLKEMGEHLDVNDKENLRRYSIIGALTLYLDFINLFLMLLRILGDRR
ncbi:Bax inhibitor-1/YccA family protein [Xenorhabdus sp. XENO-10]|uniref:Bax inhibitor-1/YccA family protein n=1 Tax=Xenorhabdus yunnanensis TaxID=3025878 RepID=A0ABT5LD67_9GAMM|nr:Bax inhibitor-1/YccA family protein [Xenorhabdus yunnanensis]MDC9589041.1 Bax inhibitor-1/YccA family protein [Xenorhabdus yunnanensis]